MTRGRSASTSFIGRRAELRELHDWLSGPPSLATLTGPPGVGKSRLARELLAELGSRESPEPLSLLLVNVRDEAGSGSLLRRIAMGLRAAGLSDSSVADKGARDAGGASPSDDDVLRDALCSLDLLVVDDFDLLVSDSREAMGRWVDRSQRARILVTSRQRLGVSGERVMELAPLAVPESGLNDREIDGVRLFLDRARLSQREFELTSVNEHDVFELVRWLDGLPLAVELAASQMRVMTARGLRDRLVLSAQALASLDVGEEEPRSLQAAIHRSWSLLDELAQRALLCLAAFPDDFDLAAAQAVLDEDPAPAVAVLRDRSLLARTGPTGSERFRLLRPIRAFVLAIPKAKPTAVGTAEREARLARSRHAAWFAAIARTCETGREPSVALECDAASFEAAFEHIDVATASSGDLDAKRDALRLATLLARLPSTGYPLAAAAARLERALERFSMALPFEVDAPLEADAWLELGRVRTKQGHREPALLALRRALELAERMSASTADVEKLAIGTLGEAELAFGHIEGAQTHFAGALATTTEATSANTTTTTIMSSTTSGSDVDDGLRFRRALWRAASCASWDEGLAELERAVAETSARGPERSAALALLWLVAARIDAGQLDEAEAPARRGRTLAESSGERRLSGLFERIMGNLSHLEGDLLRAEERYRAAEIHLFHSGAQAELARVHVHLGLVLVGAGRWEEARALLDGALVISRAIDDRRLGTLGRTARALVELHEDHLAAAGRWLKDARRELEAVVTSDRFQYGTMIELVEIQYNLARAVRAHHEGRVDDARSHLERALRKAEGETNVPPPPTGSPTIEIPLLGISVAGARRLALRVIEASSRPARAVLRIGPDALWFQLGTNRRVSLHRRGAVRRLLLALSKRHGLAQGGLDVHEAFAEGWPGEAIGAPAAADRVYWAIKTLRSLGLRDIIERRDDGYRIASDVSLRRAND